MTKGTEWSSADFCERLKERLAPTIGSKGVLKCSSSGFGYHEMAVINYYNVPSDAAKALPHYTRGAVAENNRLMLTVEGFGRGEGEPSPTGKVKLATSVWSFSMPRWGVKRPRGKTAAPAKVLDSVVAIVERVLELEPAL
jgi:hypothetical protein